MTILFLYSPFLIQKEQDDGFPPKGECLLGQVIKLYVLSFSRCIADRLLEGKV